MAGLGRVMRLMKGGVTRLMDALARTASLMEDASSNRLRSLFMEPVSYSESMLPRENSFPAKNTAA